MDIALRAARSAAEMEQWAIEALVLQSVVHLRDALAATATPDGNR